MNTMRCVVALNHPIDAGCKRVTRYVRIPGGTGAAGSGALPACALAPLVVADGPWPD